MLCRDSFWKPPELFHFVSWERVNATPTLLHNCFEYKYYSEAPSKWPCSSYFPEKAGNVHPAIGQRSSSGEDTAVAYSHQDKPESKEAPTDDQNWGVLPGVLESYKLIYSKMQLFLPTKPCHPLKCNLKISWVLWQSKLLFASSYSHTSLLLNPYQLRF